MSAAFSLAVTRGDLASETAFAFILPLETKRFLVMVILQKVGVEHCRSHSITLTVTAFPSAR